MWHPGNRKIDLCNCQRNLRIQKSRRYKPLQSLYTATKQSKKQSTKRSTKQSKMAEEGGKPVVQPTATTPAPAVEKKEKKPKKLKKVKKEGTPATIVENTDGEVKEKKKKKKKKTKKENKDSTPSATVPGETTEVKSDKPKKAKKSKDKKSKEYTDTETKDCEEKKKKKKVKKEKKQGDDEVKEKKVKKDKKTKKESSVSSSTSSGPSVSEISSVGGPVDTSSSAPTKKGLTVGRLNVVEIDNIPQTTTAFDLTNIKGTDTAPIENKNDFKIHSRVDYGTKGTKVDVLTNHVMLTAGDDLTGKQNSELDPWWKSAFIYTYHIDFKPKEKPAFGGNQKGRSARPPPPPAPLSKPKKYELIEALFHEDKTLYKYKDRIAFNGEETLYSHVPLEEFTLFDGCWDVSNKQKNKTNAVGLNNNEKHEMNELASQVTLKFVSKVGLSEIYKGTLNKNPEDQENKMSAPDKTVLLSLLGVKFLQSNDPVFQVHGNKFFIYNQYSKTKQFQIGAYLIHGFTVSLRYAYGSVLLNTVNVALPFYKHTKYLPGDPNFKNNDKVGYSLMDWLIECYGQAQNQRNGNKPGMKLQIPTEKDLNLFVDKNRDIKDLIKGLKCYRPYINYSVNPDGTPKPPKKMQSKGIVGFARETADSLKFRVLPSDLANKPPVPGEKEVMMTTTAYFAKKYNIKLKYPNVKLVSLGGANVVPAECLTIVPGQKLKGKIYDDKSVIDFTALRPADKFKAIAKLALPSIKNALTTEEDSIDAPHDSDYCFLKVPSRVIDAPTVQYENSQVTYEDKPFGSKVAGSKSESQETKGNWNLQDHQFIQTPDEELTLRAVFVNDTDRAPPLSVMDDLKKSMAKFASDVAQVGVKFNTSAQPILINEFDSPVKKVTGGFGVPSGLTE